MEFYREKGSGNSEMVYVTKDIRAVPPRVDEKYKLRTQGGLSMIEAAKKLTAPSLMLDMSMAAIKVTFLPESF